MPNPAATEYRAAYAVRAAALPHAAPVLPAPPAPTSSSVLTEAGPTRCVRQLTWTPGVFVMDPCTAERVMAAALRSTMAASGDGCQAAGPLATPLSSVMSGHSDRIAERGKPATEGPSLSPADDPGSNRGARDPGMGVAVADLGGLAAPGAAGGVANVLIVRRDMGNTAQVRVPKKDARLAMPRRPHQKSRPAHTRAVALLGNSRCAVIVDTDTDVSLVSARALRPGVRYLPRSERGGRITGVAQQGGTILGRVFLRVQLGPVRAHMPLLVALGVGFDAILGVDFLYEHGISVNLAQHYHVFEAHNGLIVSFGGHHSRFNHACALTHDVSLCPGAAHALVQCTCECPRAMARSPGAPEMYLIAARRDYQLGLVIPEQLSSG